MHKIFHHQITSSYKQLGYRGLKDLSSFASGLNEIHLKEFNRNRNLINFSKSIIFKDSLNDSNDQNHLLESEIIEEDGGTV